MPAYPANWVVNLDSPCYIMIGNWLDATENKFVTDYNIVFVIRAAGENPDTGPKPPKREYGFNDLMGCQPTAFNLPINHRDRVCTYWKDMCVLCLDLWKAAKVGQHPPTIFIHCNEAINRAPGLAAVLVSKLQGCQPEEVARELARHRAINPMYSLGQSYARGQNVTTWSCMHAVVGVQPFRMLHRDSAVYTSYHMWTHVPVEDRVLEYRPKQSATIAKVQLIPRWVANPRTYDDQPVLEVDDNEYTSDIGPVLQQYLDTENEGIFDFNQDGRHVLHQLAEDYRSPRNLFNMTLWNEAMWATYALCDDGLNVRTIGSRPLRATVLSCACKHPWKARGCQPNDQAYCVGSLLEWNCDPNLPSNQCNTVMMEMAGAGNVAVFKVFYTRIMQNYWSCDLDFKNEDGRNLWSLAGMAHDDAGQHHLRPSSNDTIKSMIKDLERSRYVRPGGLATP